MHKIPLHEFGKRYQWNLREAPFIITANNKPRYVVLLHDQWKQEQNLTSANLETEGYTYETEGGDLDMAVRPWVKFIFKVVALCLFVVLIGLLIVQMNQLTKRVAVLEMRSAPVVVVPTVEVSPTASPTAMLKQPVKFIPAVKVSPSGL